MNMNQWYKKAAAVTVAAALLAGGTTTFASGYGQDYNGGSHTRPTHPVPENPTLPSVIDDTYGFSHITRFDALKIPKQQHQSQFEVPAFNKDEIRNIPSAVGKDANGNTINLDVWDTWPLQNADGTVANYNGYEIVFGLAGDPKVSSDTFIYLFYKKANDQSLDAWKNAGRVFKDTDKLVPNDWILNHQSEEWSGSATMTKDGKVRLFYTNRHPWDADQGFYGKQTLTTAQVNVSQPSDGTLKVDGVEDFKSIFDGDGKMYQTVNQAFSAGDYSDNHTLRDPHYVEDNGHKYLVFEANTGSETGYQGDEMFYNKAYYGGNDAFFNSEREKLLNSSDKDYMAIANGALGIIELNDDYSLKRVMKPLIASNTVTDEIERANIFKMNGKWYLFTDTRGAKMFLDGVDAEDIYMLGYVSDSIDGPYKPLNGSGLVLHQDLNPRDVTWTYAHFAIPQVKGNKVVITSYMTNRGYFANQQSTFAPSFEVAIRGNHTAVVPNSTLNQGQVTTK